MGKGKRGPKDKKSKARKLPDEKAAETAAPAGEAKVAAAPEVIVPHEKVAEIAAVEPDKVIEAHVELPDGTVIAQGKAGWVRQLFDAIGVTQAD
jgi:hypothetical protein